MANREQTSRGEDAVIKRVFLKDDKVAWVPAVIVEKSKTEARCRLEETDEERTVKLKDYRGFELPRQNAELTADLVDMVHLHEPGILYNIMQRHAQGKPYTRSGDLVVAVNPFQWMANLYSENNRNFYAKQLVWQNSHTDPRQGLEPHIYEVSALSYAELAFQGRNQSILITGESGSGKTEATKLMMHHIATIQRGPVSTFEPSQSSTDLCDTVQRILHANPLLEAFGNAATARNDNSSRFGKYTQLQFDKGDPTLAAYNLRSKALCVLAGSYCEVYLLETSRVCTHAANERTYHIFYQLLAAPDSWKSQIWEGLIGKTAADYMYIGAPPTDSIEGVSDADSFLEICSALGQIGMRDSAVILLMRAICMVMLLGNIGFDVDPTTDDRAVVRSKDEFVSLSKLAGISEEDLLLAFTERTMTTRGETFKVPRTASSAKEACDALAKDIYLRTFSWLVRTINDKTCAEKNYKHNTTHGEFGVIGLLDIFGFETFETNGFGQLCINYCNERLHQKAIKDIFRSVQAEYAFEGVSVDHVEVDDNEQVLKVIEGRIGLIALLNEECYRPKGNDKAFVSKVLENHKDSKFVLTPKRGAVNQFGVAHYAGNVMYTAEKFVESNQDTLPIDLKECARKCTNSIVADQLSNDSSTNRLARQAEGCFEPVANSRCVTAESTNCLTSLPPVLAFASKLGEVVTGTKSACNMAQVVPWRSERKPTSIRSEAKTMKEESPFSSSPGFMKGSAGRSPPLVDKLDSFGEKLTNKSSIASKRTLSERSPHVAESGSTAGVLKRSTSSDLMAATVWMKYQEQLSSLMVKLGGTHSRYVRCIKPNSMKTPKACDRQSTVEQLRCAGIVATVKLSRAVFPHSLPNRLLSMRYLSMWDKQAYPSKAKRVDKPERRAMLECEALLACTLKQLEVDRNGKRVLPYAVGKTRTYFQKGALEWLEAKRVHELDRIATMIEKRARGVLCRLHMSRIRMTVCLIQKWYRDILKRRRRKLDFAATVIQKRARGVLTRLYQSKVLLTVPLLQRWYIKISKQRKLARIEPDRLSNMIQRWYRWASKQRRQRRDALATTIQKRARGVLTRLRVSMIRRAVPRLQSWYRRTSKQRKLGVPLMQRRRYLEARSVFERNQLPPEARSVFERNQLLSQDE